MSFTRDTRFLALSFSSMETISLIFPKFSLSVSDRLRSIFMHSGTMQLSTHAWQCTQRSSIMPTPSFDQYRALVGQTLMQSLHWTPMQVYLFTVIFPSGKRSLTLVVDSSSWRWLCSFFGSSFSLLSSKPNMSTEEESVGGI